MNVDFFEVVYVSALSLYLPILVLVYASAFCYDLYASVLFIN